MHKYLSWVASFFAAIGALNWGLVAFWRFNLVEYIDNLTGAVGINMFIYALIALAGLYSLIALLRP